jgi:hypothetical protein
MRAKSLGTRAVTLDKPVNLSVLMRCLSIDVITESFCGWVATPLELRYCTIYVFRHVGLK